MECQTVSSLLKLWRHECTRVIADRCTSPADRDWFTRNLKRQVAEELGTDIYNEHFSEDPSYWVDYLRDPPEPTGDEPEDFCFDAPKIYEEIPSWDFLLERTYCKYF